ncbi:MAG: hypothetical protein INH43_22580 [Acidobacteriaceae bacterium]|jgi:transcriptional regulator with XRE-family HTH domain|nr:hypothetical protein [Acidobacteriaceae bacterium]
MSYRPLRISRGLNGKAQTMEEAGQKLKRVRERLNLRYRDVEDASLRIAERHQNDEFVVALSRLSDIENKGTVPTVFRLYTLCTIYRLDLLEVLQWYGVDLSHLPADAAAIELEKTHAIQFQASHQGEVLLPLVLDPGLDLTKTTYLSRMIQRWGKLPLMLLHGLDLKTHRYAFVGSEDWSMYPLLQPGSLLLLDETKRKIVPSGWTNEFDRPIYFLEHREGYACGWCNLDGNRLVLQPHPASMCNPQVFLYPDEIDVIGQVTGVAMRLDHGRRRRNGSAGG